MLALWLVATGTLGAQDLQKLKLTGRWPGASGANRYLGGYYAPSVALSEKWIIAGSQGGLVQVFDATTGAWVRSLSALAGGALPEFGFSCAILGNVAVIGGYSSSVYVFDVSTGKKLIEIKSPTMAADGFGASVGISSFGIVVGAPNSNDLRGAAYLFDRRGNYIARFQPADSVANDYVGEALAIDGGLVAISARGASALTGCAYVYDLRSVALVKKLVPTGGVAGDEAGGAIAMSGGRVFLGAGFGPPNQDGKIFQFNLAGNTQKILVSSSLNYSFLGTSLVAEGGLLLAGCGTFVGSPGTLHVFDINSNSTTEMQRIVEPDGVDNAYGGSALALHQGTAVAAAGEDATLGTNSGALCVSRTMSSPLGMTKVAARGDYAPGMVDASYGSFGEAFIDPLAEVAYSSTLTGLGSSNGKAIGAWSDLYGSVGHRALLGAGTVLSLGRPVLNRSDRAFYQTRFTGPGVTAFNNEGIITQLSGVNSLLIRSGDAVNLLSRTTRNFPTFVQAGDSDNIACSFNLRTGAGFAATAIDDSGLFLGTAGELTEVEQEYESIGGDANLYYGQFTGRVALYDTAAIYSVGYNNLGAGSKTGQALISKSTGANEVIVATTSTVNRIEPGGSGARYSAFLGETSDDNNLHLFRATLAADSAALPTAPITAANNEVLCTRNAAGTYTRVLRKGDGIPALGGLKVSKIINYWEVYAQTMMLVQLSGTGVTTANDMALLLYQSSPVAGLIEVLLREGDSAPGCGAATIGIISRVEVETYLGHYLVLVTLAGAPSNANLALLRGYSHADITSGQSSLRRPSTVLRKGTLYSNQPSKLKSISLPTGNITAGGAGTTGLGSAMSRAGSSATASNIVLTLEFENGVRQVMKGIP